MNGDSAAAPGEERANLLAQTTAVPEPSTLALIGGELIVFAMVQRKRR